MRTCNLNSRNAFKFFLFSRYYATGDSFVDLSYGFRIAPQTISVIIHSMSDVIYKVLREEYLPVPTNEKWKQISKEYLDYRQIPQCLGSIDGKHIRIQKPEKGGSLWYNYKKFHSLHLMVSVDANYVFTIIVPFFEIQLLENLFFEISLIFQRRNLFRVVAIHFRFSL